MNNAALFTARLLIGALLIGGAVQKAVAPQAAGTMLTDASLPFALIWVAMVYDALAGLALWLGIAVGPVATSAAVYCAVTSFFHLAIFLDVGDAWQMTIFVKNWAVAGGCLALAVAGAGAWRVGGGAHA